MSSVDGGLLFAVFQYAYIASNHSATNETRAVTSPHRVALPFALPAAGPQNVIDRETATQLFHFLDVEEDASVIFTGDTVVNRVIENNYVFFNSGTME